jgi:hypothetical protein
MINDWAGQIVGIIYCQTASPQESGKKFDVIFTPPHYHAARWLEEVNSLNTTIAEVALVRRTLAWITGIILLVSTLMGVSFWWNTHTFNIILHDQYIAYVGHVRYSISDATVISVENWCMIINLFWFISFSGRHVTSCICQSQGTRFSILMSSLIRHGNKHMIQIFLPNQGRPGCRWTFWLGGFIYIPLICVHYYIYLLLLMDQCSQFLTFMVSCIGNLFN